MQTSMASRALRCALPLLSPPMVCASSYHSPKHFQWIPLRCLVKKTNPAAAGPTPTHFTSEGNFHGVLAKVAHALGWQPDC